MTAENKIGEGKKFERIRRITGYDAKKAEARDPVKHMGQRFGCCE